MIIESNIGRDKETGTELTPNVKQNDYMRFTEHKNIQLMGRGEYLVLTHMQPETQLSINMTIWADWHGY